MEPVTYFVLLPLTLLYLATGLFLHAGLSKKYLLNSALPKVSVIIAARNEEQLLPHCLASLAELNYPKDKLQIILANDRSTDNTEHIAKEFAAAHPHADYLNITEDKYNLKSKMNVLAQAIEACSGEIICITDADCRVTPDWVAEMVKHFDDDTGMVCGYTHLHSAENRPGIFQHIQSVDWMFLQTIASATAGAGLPVTVLGNNIAFRRSAYEDIGGFKGIGFSVTEDFALMRALLKSKKWKIAYPQYSGVKVISEPLRNWSEFYRQRKRWAAGGKKAGIWGYILMLTAALSHLVIPAFLLFSTNLIWPLVSLVLLLTADASFLYRASIRLREKLLWQYFLPFEIFYFFYTFVFAFVVPFSKTVEWKSRTFDTAK